MMEQNLVKLFLWPTSSKWATCATKALCKTCVRRVWCPGGETAKLQISRECKGSSAQKELSSRVAYAY